MSRGRRAGRVVASAGWLVATYGLLVRPWHLRWGATEDEVRRPLPGDDLVPTPIVAATRAINIDRPSSLGGGKTRLVIRGRASFALRPAAWAFWIAFDAGDFVMMRKEMVGIKRRAESRR